MQIVKEGYPFISVPLILGTLLIILGLGKVMTLIGISCLVVSMFCLYFFRDPKIEITRGNDIILSPCNGTVLEVSENESEKVVRVFLSIFDVHLQRAPISGKVVSVEHKSGKFLIAMGTNAHIANEQNIITIENSNARCVVKQIAGLIARRCVAWVEPDDVLNIGDKIGIIKFSSQVDLHMPKNVDVKVKEGDKVVSGVTVFANINK